MPRFLPDLPEDLILAALSRSPGHELRTGKFDGPESSAALVANAFGWFLQRPALLPALPGVPAGQVETVLGSPESRVASGAGERWRYRGPGCTLDLFLFPDVGSGGLVVLDRRAGGASEQECLRRMRDGA